MVTGSELHLFVYAGAVALLICSVRVTASRWLVCRLDRSAMAYTAERALSAWMNMLYLGWLCKMSKVLVSQIIFSRVPVCRCIHQQTRALYMYQQVRACFQRGLCVSQQNSGRAPNKSIRS